MSSIPTALGDSFWGEEKSPSRPLIPNWISITNATTTESVCILSLIKRDVQACYKKLAIHIPQSYVGSDYYNAYPFNVGTIELAGRYSGQSTDCINKWMSTINFCVINVHHFTNADSLRTKYLGSCYGVELDRYHMIRSRWCACVSRVKDIFSSRAFQIVFVCQKQLDCSDDNNKDFWFLSIVEYS